ncbi:hypothetical protein QNH39_04310 [Neobacillus novalis]|uniref:Uncharacterized protein n=1 Tax=Neobacillus novalis TaxID=220687 RepID=A0AA95MVK5_9BACI|nr:hypothetical protein [Neobacillus novalis]WHY87093.1 hypothetical protein QNH39_04310 [Neobacillus novalis]
MTQSIARLGKFTSILSGILLIFAHSFNFGAGEFGTSFGNLLVFFAHLLLVFAFFSLYFFLGENNGILGFLAMLFGIIGNIIVTSIVYVEIAQAFMEKASPVFNTPLTEPSFLFGPLLFVLGMILFGITIIRSKVLPAYSGCLLLIGTIVFAAASVAGIFQAIIEVLGAIFTGAGLILTGIKFDHKSFNEKNGQSPSL